MAFIILMGFIALIALPSVIWVYALIDVIRNDFKHIATKIVWIINSTFAGDDLTVTM